MAVIAQHTQISSHYIVFLKLIQCHVSIMPQFLKNGKMVKFIKNKETLRN